MLMPYTRGNGDTHFLSKAALQWWYQFHSLPTALAPGYWNNTHDFAKLIFGDLARLSAIRLWRRPSVK